MGILNILNKTAKTTATLGKHVGEDALNVGKKMFNTVKDSKKAYTYLDYIKDGKGYDETIRLMTGYSLPMTSKAGMIGLGSYGAYQTAKTTINLKNKSARGASIQSNIPYNRLTNDFSKPKIDNLGATGDTVFGMHNGR